MPTRTSRPRPGGRARSAGSPTPSATSSRKRKAVEAAGTRVRYLNIGDPVAFGFQTPPHLIEAATRAMRDGHNGYLPSAGIPAAREAVAADYAARGVPVSPDRVLITTGTSGGHRAGAQRAGRRRRRGAGAVADLSAVHGGARQDRRDSRGTTGPIPARDWLPDLDHLRSLVTPTHARARRHRSEQPDRRRLSDRGAPGADRARRAARA